MQSLCLALLALRIVWASQIPLVYQRSSEQLERCLSKSSILFETRDSPHYEDHRQTYQLRKDLQWQPAALTFPTTPEQVASAVQCAAKTGYKAVARGGGHSAIGGSLGGRDGAVVIDLAHFDGVTMDHETGVAKVGAGIRQGPAYLEVYKQGQRFFAGGVCPNIGLSGAVSHGAYGFAHRMYGLASDNVLAYDVVLANGTIAHVNATQHSDLYWGLRGAASSFAIVTAFYMQTHPAPVTQIYSWSLVVTAKELSDFIMIWQDWANSPNAVSQIHSASFAIPAVEPGWLNLTFYVTGFGDVDLTERATPLLKALPKPTMARKDMPWLDVASLYGMPLDLHDITTKAAHYEKSIIMSQDWPRRGVEAVYDFLANQSRSHDVKDPNGVPETRVIFDLLGGYDSALNRVSRETSSWYKRDAKWILWTIVNNKDSRDLPQASIDFVDGIYERMLGGLAEEDWGSYLNYADTRIDDYKRRYYGSNYDRLSALKRKVDPTDFFNSPLGVKP